MTLLLLKIDVGQKHQSEEVVRATGSISAREKSKRDQADLVGETCLRRQIAPTPLSLFPFHFILFSLIQLFSRVLVFLLFLFISPRFFFVSFPSVAYRSSL